MDAPPDKIWDLVADVTQIGRYSPETFEAEWLDGATGPEVGAKFRGHVKRNGRGPIYWTTCTVSACEPGREFVFGAGPGPKPWTIWGYHLEPSGDGTDVTESFDIGANPFVHVYWAIAGRARGRTNRNGMRQTLERIKTEVESEVGHR
jgi:uncharacterized protein YndB with AHSA1/START domain